MTTITAERIDKMTNIIATGKNVKPSHVKPSEEAKQMDRLLQAKESTKRFKSKL